MESLRPRNREPNSALSGSMDFPYPDCDHKGLTLCPQSARPGRRRCRPSPSVCPQGFRHCRRVTEVNRPPENESAVENQRPIRLLCGSYREPLVRLLNDRTGSRDYNSATESITLDTNSSMASPVAP